MTYCLRTLRHEAAYLVAECLNGDGRNERTVVIEPMNPDWIEDNAPDCIPFFERLFDASGEAQVSGFQKLLLSSFEKTESNEGNSTNGRVSKPSEGDLDQAFARAFEADGQMRAWLLGGGRFARLANEARLLIDEQIEARSTTVNNWWRWWWCKLPDGSESETDLFFVFQHQEMRFAIHIENKPRHGKISLKQASDYRRRAAFMSNDPRWLDYSDFETILLAPKSLIETNPEEASQFDRCVFYESVAPFVPLFRAATA